MSKCANPECDSVRIFARGHCAACYSRLRRRGTLARANVVNAGICSFEGCGEKAFAKNLCQRHYSRQEDPMTRLWKNLRAKAPGAYPAEWDDRGAFLAALPPRPDGVSQLRRLSPEKPWSTENMYWKSALEQSAPPRSESRRDYQRAYNHAWSMDRKYGLTEAMREDMETKQGGVCAICGEAETAVNPRDSEGKPRRLGVDHCHRTGKNRGLLCVRCNTMIGRRGADDRVELLLAAVEYLRRHDR